MVSCVLVATLGFYCCTVLLCSRLTMFRLTCTFSALKPNLCTQSRNHGQGKMTDSTLFFILLFLYALHLQYIHTVSLHHFKIKLCTNSKARGFICNKMLLRHYFFVIPSCLDPGNELQIIYWFETKCDKRWWKHFLICTTKCNNGNFKDFAIAIGLKQKTKTHKTTRRTELLRLAFVLLTDRSW